MQFPTRVFSGYHGACHCQGIAVDKDKGYLYYSFTTKLIKADLLGNVIGSVDGLVGHLGCIDFCQEDGRVYGSLEFKNDAIGKGILEQLGKTDRVLETAFYCAIFDVDRINRLGMDAMADDVMRAVYLPAVASDYHASVMRGQKEIPHRYACSGIDGIAWGPAFGKRTGAQYLQICYGIYGDVTRDDNDYQVILTYDARDWWAHVAEPLSATQMHKSGAACIGRYFLYTGNTNWGVQNLEYDPYSGNWLVAVYPGKKPQFDNFSMFVIDGSAAPKKGRHLAYGEVIDELQLAGASHFLLGATGMASLGDGYYYFSDHAKDPKHGQYTNVLLYRASADAVAFFERMR